MKKSNFDPKKFLNVKSLSPLESKAITGGMADVKDKKKDKKADIVCHQKKVYYCLRSIFGFQI